jgi:hypothetical protein
MASTVPLICQMKLNPSADVTDAADAKMCAWGNAMRINRAMLVA